MGAGEPQFKCMCAWLQESHTFIACVHGCRRATLFVKCHVCMGAGEPHFLLSVM